MHERKRKKKRKKEKGKGKRVRRATHVYKTTNQHFKQMRNAISEQRGAAASTAFARDLFIRLHPSSTASNLRPFHGIFTFPLLSLFITAVSPIITAVDGGNRSQAEAPLRALASSRFLSGIGEVKPLPETRLPVSRQARASHRKSSGSRIPIVS